VKRFAGRLGLFVALNAAIGILVLAAVDARYAFEQWQTDSLLLSTPRDTHFDLVILGTSHARLFTRIKHNYDFLSDALDMQVFNLAIPFGGGILLEKMYLRNFFERGNRADILLYFLDPYVFFSPLPNKYHKFVYYEPLRMSFLLEMIRNGMPFERVFTYIRSKFTYRWITQEPVLIAYESATLADWGIALEPKRMRARAESLYPDGLSQGYFQYYSPMLGEVLEMARAHQCRMILAFPPTLLGHEKGAPQVLELIEGYRKQYDFEFCDFTAAIDDVDLYYDYDHLNSPGLEAFVTRFLEPVLTERKGS